MVAEFFDLDTQDRLTPILASVGTLSFADILVETPDTNEGKALSGLAKSLTNAARQKLKQLNRFQEGHRRLPRLHLLLLSGNHILVGVSYPPQSSPYAGGIQHLKLPKDAPSRAILKLEEAAIQLLSRQQREHWIRPGMSAVDLGAAPGGWTWWLTQQGMQVIAIDNAKLSDAVMKTGQVEHLRVDGFSWQPRHPVHWICCDMVEQPRRVAKLMARWLSEGWAQAALFNLKLPMKKRYNMVIQCLSLFDHLSDSHSLVAKQLYHDREEITVVLLPRG
jgi:23S rRNA (cytidine2498-2'-O)-methyltransferase